MFPESVDVKVADTAVAAHGATNVWKHATLEDGLKILVPPFIAPGETIRVDIERGTYMERARKK